MTGEIKKIKSEKGYGFIKPDNQQQDIFFHMYDLVPGVAFKDLRVGDKVDYNIADTFDGKSKAVEIIVVKR